MYTLNPPHSPSLYILLAVVFIAANCLSRLMVPDSDSWGRNIDSPSSFSKSQNAFVGHWQAHGALACGFIPRPSPSSCFLAGCGWRASAEHCFSQEWGVCRHGDWYLSISAAAAAATYQPGLTQDPCSPKAELWSRTQSLSESISLSGRIVNTNCNSA